MYENLKDEEIIKIGSILKLFAHFVKIDGILYLFRIYEQYESDLNQCALLGSRKGKGGIFKFHKKSLS